MIKSRLAAIGRMANGCLRTGGAVKRRLPRAVFLDRDDTIAEDVPYCSRVEDFHILPRVPESIRLLNDYGFKVAVVTNQSGLARGYFTKETLALIHQKMCDDLAEHGARVDGIYVCPHHPDDGCECRKPKPTLLLRAAEEMGVVLHFSYMVGDDAKDIEAGRAASCRTVLLRTRSKRPDKVTGMVQPDYVTDSLYEAVQWIMKDADTAVI
ncbi:MAG: D-glycero-beta-D-manno-heptose 1,7-bisphosphate 7-phosphatase [Chloroflexi bacterium]|nr:D-glycero-beta-D-manno-heptose 1,7-bisphosphate 7-phosphatase [Chloroflexota bacterium]